MQADKDRVVLKLSGEALAGRSGGMYDDAVIDEIAGQLKQVQAEGIQISLVVGGGNIWRGVKAKQDMDRTKSDQIGMLGTVMNAIYMSEQFKKSGLLSTVMTPFAVGAFTQLFSKDLALKLMSEGHVIINAGGSGHPFFSTDTITALRAAELDASCVLYAKSVDGVYDKDPSKYSDAKRFKTVSYKKILHDNLDASDIAAMSISSDVDMDSLIFGLLDNKGNVQKDCLVNACLLAVGRNADISATRVAKFLEEEYDG